MSRTLEDLNLSLFKSWHALVALGVVAAFVALEIALGADSGRGPGHDPSFLLATGWGSLGLFLTVLGYVLRKYMHKLGYSPEFRRRVELGLLEDFDERLNGIRLEVLRGALTRREDVAAAVQKHRVESGVQRVVRVDVEDGPEGGPAFTLRARPTEPFGRSAKWLHAHVFYGAAFAVLVGLHGGGHSAGTLALLLNVLALLVVVSGAVGIVLWALGPAWLSRRERRFQLTIEQANALDKSYAAKIDAALAQHGPDVARAVAGLRGSGTGRSSEPYAARARRAAEDFARRAPSEAHGDLLDLLVLVGQHRRVRAALGELSRVRLSFMAWRAVHVPSVVLLAAAATVHVVSIWKY